MPHIEKSEQTRRSKKKAVSGGRRGARLAITTRRKKAISATSWAAGETTTEKVGTGTVGGSEQSVTQGGEGQSGAAKDDNWLPEY
jgi:hypothetical protein